MYHRVLLFTLLSLTSGCVEVRDRQDRGFLTNDAFITGLHTGLTLDSAEQIFTYVFELKCLV